MKNNYRYSGKVLFLTICILLMGSIFTDVTAQVDVKKYEEKKNVKKLISFIQDEKLAVNSRLEAVSAIARLKDVSAVEPLIVLLENKQTNTKIRQTTVFALGELRDARAIDALIEALDEEDLKTASIHALGKIGGDKVIARLVKELTGKQSSGRELTATVLTNLNWEPKTDSESIFFLVAKHDWEALVKLGDVAIEPLVYTLESGNTNAKIGALKTLNELGWQPDAAHEADYKAAEALSLELMIYREKIIADEMKLLTELKLNLQKLNEAEQSGDSILDEESIGFLKQRFNNEIDFEQKEVDSFRAAVYKIKLTINKIGDKTYIGRESKGGTVMMYEVIRNPQNKNQITGGTWYNLWTGNPSKTFEWDGDKVNFYRFNRDGQKYLYAILNFRSNRQGLIQVEFVDASGNPTEKVSWVEKNGVSSRIGDDEWVQWPGDTTLVQERLKFVEAAVFAKPSSNLK